MEKLVKRLANNRKVIFDTGKFDNWCVYVVESNGNKKAPFDETYFSELKILSKKYLLNKVYDDFVKIYRNTTKEIDQRVILRIDAIVNTYHDEDKIVVEQWMAVLYAGMIAEENKEFARLKKRIKRLGMHQVLILNMPVNEAAKFSTGKKWRDLDAIMKTLGF